MATTEKDAFKIGFLTRCAEEGLNKDQVTARLALLEKSAGWGEAMNSLATLSIGVPIAGGLVGGGLLGYGAAKMTEPNLSDDEIKAQELAQTYKVYAERLKARRKLKQYRHGA